MGRRFKRVIMLLALLCIGLQSVTVSAQTVVNKVLLAEQAKGKAPNVKVYMTGSEMSSEVSVSGTVSDISLLQNGDIKTFDDSGESIRYIILLDNSGSINKDQFDEAIKQLVKLRENMKNSDEMQLYTVGATDVSDDKKDVFGRIVVATETDQVKGDKKKIKKIKYITDASSKTILYRSLNEVLEEQSSQVSMDNLRTVVLVITDGEDDSDDVNGKDNDKDSTLENVCASSIPVYGILLNNTSKSSNESKIKFTKNKIFDADNGKGYYYNCSNKSGASVVKKAFDEMDKILRQQTYVVNLTTTTNKNVAGKSTLNLSVNNQAINPVILDYSDYEKEVSAPIVVGIVEKEGKNSVTFNIEDEYGVNISDAKDKAHYTIQTDSEEADGKVWTIAQVNIKEEGNAVTVTLTVDEEEFFNEDYVLTIDGIRDKSKDQNAMNNVRITFSVEDGLDADIEAVKDFVQKYWWIALIILILIIGIITITIVTKNKSVKIVEMNPDELSKADSRMIRLTIKDRAGAIKDVEWNVEGSLFVGRSDICNIFFDDDRLSKQHFVIEVTKLGCYIEDLESTNGTFVNGVKMTNRRLLLNGDIITAGREEIVFRVEKCPILEESNKAIQNLSGGGVKCLVEKRKKIQLSL